MSLILSDEAMMDAIRKHHLLHSDAVVYITDDDRAVAQAAGKHCLEQLEKEGMLRCDFAIQMGKNRCYRKTCRRCAALKEVRA